MRWKSSHWAGPLHKLLIDITTVFHHLPLALRKVTAEPGLFSCINQLHVNTEMLSCSSLLPANLPLPPNKLTLSCHILPLSQRYADRGLSKDIKSSKGTSLRLFELVYRWWYPDLWTLRETTSFRGLTTGQCQQRREGGQEAATLPQEPYGNQPCVAWCCSQRLLAQDRWQALSVETPFNCTTWFPLCVNAGDNLRSAR